VLFTSHCPKVSHENFWLGWAMRSSLHGSLHGTFTITPLSLGTAFSVVFFSHKRSSEVRSPELVWEPHRYRGCRLFLCWHPWHKYGVYQIAAGAPASGPYSKQRAGGRDKGCLLRNPRHLTLSECYLHLTVQKLVMRSRLSVWKAGKCSLLPLQIQTSVLLQGRR